ncbi:MAG: NERD domain-containing protein [Bacteroidales bacterium]|nr:NERD domain-containing protein [Bacteroidales bacterium]
MITYFVIFILALVAFVCLLWFLPSKGKAGKMRVAKILSKLPEEEYRVINNLLIKQGNKTTQIDHVVVSEYRIFVIETKHYRGWIYGDANREYWTQNIYGNKYDLWNPIHQNQGHIRALRRVLTDIPPGVFISIVTFSRQASLDIRNSENVIYWDELKKLICSYQRKLISTEQAQNAYETLLTANIDSKDNQKQHVRHVREQISKREETIAKGRCPRCGGELVLRKGTYGPFYGCSNYPRCKFTHKLS